MEPRDYQENARDQIIAKIDENVRKIICYLPTGMGKTLIAIITLQYLIENGYLNDDEKVLFLVSDRKLKHQLHDMASTAGLGNYGNLFILPEGKDYPANLVREHSNLSRFIFATPILFSNALIARSVATQRLDKAILQQIKVVIIDEILDVLAQSYGKKRTKEETINYIRKIFNFEDYEAFIMEYSSQHGMTPQQADFLFEKEYAPRYYRVNMLFEPVLKMLNLLDPNARTILLGLTASITQQAKREMLVEKLGGKDLVAEIFPEGEDFENYRPSIILKKIRVIDDEISRLDSSIQELKNAALVTIKKAYRDATNNPDLPSDRVLLFVTEFLAKKELKERIRSKLKSQKMPDEEIDDLLKHYTTTASAYLLLTVGRQKLLEDTIKSFYKFVKGVKNSFLTASDTFKEIDAVITAKMETYDKGVVIISEKDKKLLYWANRLANEGKKILIMARFVNMVEHLNQILNDPANGGVASVMVHGKMDGTKQFEQISRFKKNPEIKVLVASERLIEKGTDLPEADIAIYYGSTISLERYEQSLGRIRSTILKEKTAYTISYNLTVEAEKSANRDAAFLELMQRGSKKSLIVSLDETFE